MDMTQLTMTNEDGTVETFNVRCTFAEAFEVFGNGDKRDVRENLAWYALEWDSYYGFAV